MCSKLVYPSFPLIDVVGAISLVITLPGCSGFKAQLVTADGRIKVMVPVELEVTVEVTQNSRKSLCAPRGNSAIPEVIVHAPTEVTGLDLLLWKSLPQAWSHGGG